LRVELFPPSQPLSSLEEAFGDFTPGRHGWFVRDPQPLRVANGGGKRNRHDSRLNRACPVFAPEVTRPFVCWYNATQGNYAQSSACSFLVAPENDHDPGQFDCRGQ
jgi:hypothetical protein